ncbi:MAG: hypothetical protein R3E68_05550 [Burkholderiaceae bacterium]
MTLVIPGYNEAGVLSRNLAIIFEYLRTLRARYRFEVLVINDGSLIAPARSPTSCAASMTSCR